MPDYHTIADATQTLIGVLNDGLAVFGASPPVAVAHDLQGTIATTPAQVTVFLYEVAEDASQRNRPAELRRVPPTVEIEPAPIPLILRYLITPWSGDRPTDQRILGRVVQTFHQRAIIGGAELQGVLAGTSYNLKVKLEPLDLESRTRVWQAVQKPYRLSANYEVRVVPIDYGRSRSRPMVRQQRNGFGRPLPEGSA